MKTAASVAHFLYKAVRFLYVSGAAHPAESPNAKRLTGN